LRPAFHGKSGSDLPVAWQYLSQQHLNLQSTKKPSPKQITNKHKTNIKQTNAFFGSLLERPGSAGSPEMATKQQTLFVSI
jgi:hypothetical protein